MSTTTKNLQVTFISTERDDPSDTINKRITVPCNPETSPADITTRIKTISNALTDPTISGGLKEFADGIKATFQETIKDGGDTYIYTPARISKAEIVTITEDIIYGN